MRKTDGTKATRSDGGPAFPQSERKFKPDINGGGMVLTKIDGGMTLRDYFATHADQPGASEIVAEAGLCWIESKVWVPADRDNAGECLGHFDKWWATLPLEERYRLYARVRYGIADAMLAVR